VKTAWANYSDDSRIRDDCLNAKIISQTMALSSVLHLPVFKFESRADVEQFMREYADVFHFDDGRDEIPSFREAVAAYSDAFFAEHSVVCVYMAAGSGSFRYGVRDIQIGDSSLCVHVEQINNPEVYTTEMAGWFILAELSKKDIRSCEDFDALYAGIRGGESLARLPGHIVFGTFSFEEVKGSLDMSAPGVKTEGFVNVDEVEMVWPTDRARAEVTVEYDLSQVYYDSADDVWMVRFFHSKRAGGDETVYLSGKGVTLLIVYGE